MKVKDFGEDWAATASQHNCYQFLDCFLKVGQTERSFAILQILKERLESLHQKISNNSLERKLREMLKSEKDPKRKNLLEELLTPS